MLYILFLYIITMDWQTQDERRHEFHDEYIDTGQVDDENKPIQIKNPKNVDSNRIAIIVPAEYVEIARLVSKMMWYSDGDDYKVKLSADWWEPPTWYWLSTYCGHPFVDWITWYEPLPEEYAEAQPILSVLKYRLTSWEEPMQQFQQLIHDNNLQLIITPIWQITADQGNLQ